jgi:hypothetical protein
MNLDEFNPLIRGMRLGDITRTAQNGGNAPLDHDHGKSHTRASPDYRLTAKRMTECIGNTADEGMIGGNVFRFQTGGVIPPPFRLFGFPDYNAVIPLQAFHKRIHLLLDEFRGSFGDETGIEADYTAIRNRCKIQASFDSFEITGAISENRIGSG